MEKEVRIAEFKSRLSQYLRAVRRGDQIVIKDRETPIARVVSYEEVPRRLVTRPPTKSLQEVEEMLKARPKKALRLKPGVVDRALHDTRMDSLDKWLASKSTSTRR